MGLSTSDTHLKQPEHTSDHQYYEESQPDRKKAKTEVALARRITTAWLPRVYLLLLLFVYLLLVVQYIFFLLLFLLLFCFLHPLLLLPLFLKCLPINSREHLLERFAREFVYSVTYRDSFQVGALERDLFQAGSCDVVTIRNAQHFQLRAVFRYLRESNVADVVKTIQVNKLERAALAGESFHRAARDRRAVT